MEENPHKSPPNVVRNRGIKWPRIKLSGVLWATFWTAVWGLFWIDYKPADQNPPLLIALIAGLLICPFIAVGALFGYAKRGFIVALVLVGGYALIMGIAVGMEWIHFD